MKKVPFNRPVRLPEHNDIFSASTLQDCIAGNGFFTKSVESKFRDLIGKPVRLVTSATHAMEMMALLTFIKEGDEIICPSFTFVSTANAFALRGARIIFADNDRYGNIIPSEVDRLTSPRTKAVIAVHYAGNSADMDELAALCRHKGLLLFEDAAQAVGSFYKGRALGTIGDLGCYSFHETKNITSGEGGALILGDTSYLERAEILRDKGTNRARFQQGLIDKYTWVDLGSSYVLSELSAAYLEPQIPKLSSINARRREIWCRYDAELRPILERLGVEALPIPVYNQPNYHMYASVFPDGQSRDSFIGWMREAGVICPFHYTSLHLSPFGRRFNSEESIVLPGCERLSRQLVRLPIFFNMTKLEQDYVLSCVMDWVQTLI